MNLKVKFLKGKDKSRGLIGVKKAYPVFFKTRFGIHTFGVRFPLDVVILNKKSEAVKIKTSLKPNRIFFWNPKFNKVIELPAGEIKKLKIKIGDKITLIVSS